jgi:glucosamine--fructose-6-phosphate aminotransferase (isomerizing)
LTVAVSGDAAIAEGLRALPRSLEYRSPIDTAVAELLVGASSLYTAGRGPGLAIALEAALKAKETAGLHAEAFSLAEVMHGPLGLAGRDLPVFAFLPDDAAAESNKAALRRLAEVGSPTVHVRTGSGPDGLAMMVRPTGCGLVDPIAMIAAYYELIEGVACRRGRDPDAPPHLSKVMVTV